MKRLLAMTLTVLLVISCIPLTLGVAAENAQASTLSELSDAMSANTTDDITVELTSNISVDATTTLPARTGKTTITSADPANPVTITLGGNKALKISSDVTFKDVKFAVANTSWTNWSNGQAVGRIENAAYTLTLDGVDAPYLSVYNDGTDGVLVSTVVTGGTKLGAAFIGGSSGGQKTTGTKTFNAFVKVEDSSEVTEILLAGQSTSWEWNSGSNLDGNLIVAVDNATVSKIYASSRWGQVKVLGDYYTYVSNGGVITSDTMGCDGTKYTNANYSITTDATIASISAAPVFVEDEYVLGFDIVKALGVSSEALLYNGTESIDAIDDVYYLAPGTTYSLAFRVASAGDRTITYVGGEGTTGTTPATIAAPTSTVYLAACGFAKEGFYCSGWTDGNADYDIGAEYTMPDHDVTMTALWAARPAVHLDTENGDDATADYRDPTKPFKTLEAALASLPTGDITIALDSDLTLLNGVGIGARADGSTVTIQSAGDTQKTIHVGTANNQNIPIACDVVFYNVKLVAINAGPAGFPKCDFFGSIDAQRSIMLFDCDADGAPIFLGTNTDGHPYVVVSDSSLGALWIGNHTWGGNWDFDGDVDITLINSEVTNFGVGGMGWDNNGPTHLSGSLNVIMNNSTIANLTYKTGSNSMASAGASTVANYNFHNNGTSITGTNDLASVATNVNEYKLICVGTSAKVVSVGKEHAEVEINAGSMKVFVNGVEKAANERGYYEIDPGESVVSVYKVECYVDYSAGSDSTGNGTYTSPYKTLGKVLAENPTGDINISLLSNIVVTYDDSIAKRSDGSMVHITSFDGMKNITVGEAHTNINFDIAGNAVFENVTFTTSYTGTPNFGTYNFYSRVRLSGSVKFINADASTPVFVCCESSGNPSVELDNSVLAALWVGSYEWSGAKDFTGNVKVALENGSSLNFMSLGGCGWDRGGATTLNGDLDLSVNCSSLATLEMNGGSAINGNFNYLSVNSSEPETNKIKGVAANYNRYDVTVVGADATIKSFGASNAKLSLAPFDEELPFYINGESAEPSDEYTIGTGKTEFKYDNGLGVFAYVDAANGSDGGNGSAQSPYATLGKALSANPVGDMTVYFIGSYDIGSYTFAPRVDGSVVTYCSADKDSRSSLVVEGGNQGQSASINTKVIFKDIDIRSAGANASTSADQGYSTAINVNSDVVLDGVSSWAQLCICKPGITVTLKDSGVNVIRAGTAGWSSPYDTINYDGGIVIDAENSSVSRVAVGCFGWDNNHSGAKINGSLTIRANGGDIGPIEKFNGRTGSITGNLNLISMNGARLPDNGNITVDAGTIKHYYIYGSPLDAKLGLDAKGVFLGFDLGGEGKCGAVTSNDVAVLYPAGISTLPTDTPLNVLSLECENINQNVKFHLNGGKAVGNFAHFDSSYALTFPDAPEKENALFAGWCEDQTLSTFFTSGTVVSGAKDLYAKWGTISTDPEDIDDDYYFAIRGIQVRKKDSELAQGLRFISRINKKGVFAELGEINTDNADMKTTEDSEIGYGTVVIPTDVLAGRDLMLGVKYDHEGTVYVGKDVPALNIFDETDDYVDYTAVLVNMPKSMYATSFTVRPYIKYYSASGDVNMIYGEPYSISLKDAALYIYTNGDEDDETNEYINVNIITPALGVDNILPKKVKDEIEGKISDRIAAIEANPNISASGNVYYVAADGSASNSGKSPSAPWNMSKLLSSMPGMASGSTILFKRGDVFRGNISINSANITLSAYGEGHKPIIMGSPANLAEYRWDPVEGLPNVYVCSYDFASQYGTSGAGANIGMMAFDHPLDKTPDPATALNGFTVMNGYGGFYGIDDPKFCNDLQFYFDIGVTKDSSFSGATYKLYLYSAYGNPADRFEDIEAGVGRHIINTNSCHGLTISNLELRYTGYHGISFGNAPNATIDNCTICYCGGSWHGYGGGIPIQFGNGIEAYGSANNFTVSNCHIFQCYDTGITIQTGDYKDVNNTRFVNNVLEYNHWQFEFWGNHLNITGLTIDGNYIVKTGYGYGSRTRAGISSGVDTYSFPNHSINMNVTNNLFYLAHGKFIESTNDAACRSIEYEGNTFVGRSGKSDEVYFGVGYPFTYATKGAEDAIKNVIKDTTAKIYLNYEG